MMETIPILRGNAVLGQNPKVSNVEAFTQLNYRRRASPVFRYGTGIRVIGGSRSYVVPIPQGVTSALRGDVPLMRQPQLMHPPMHGLARLNKRLLQIRHVILLAVVMCSPRRVMLARILSDVGDRPLDRRQDVLGHSLVEHLPLATARDIDRRRVRVHLVAARSEVDAVVVVAGPAAPRRQPRMPVNCYPLAQLQPSRSLPRLGGGHHSPRARRISRL